MLNHDDIWMALDRLALQFSMTPSSMARQAGLDPTTFNKSKRQGADGKPRWPSTESLSKVLNTLGVDFEDFATLVAKKNARRLGLTLGTRVPLILLEQARDAGFFDGAGFPVGEGWSDIRIPGVRNDHVYALQISGDTMMPVLRHGDRIVVAPNEEIQCGDRVVIKTRAGEVMAVELAEMNVERIETFSINAAPTGRTLYLKDVQWIARIVWITQ
ncbi:MAG: DNA-binding protein [Robiginitomaculum sp.]|nr:MAG: DNA-binding protein [Robiginitomaculum sp.]